MAPPLVAIPLAAWEREGLSAALKGAGLPTDDVADASRHFWRFSFADDIPAGFGGLELHGTDALMRSIITLPPLRGRGFARAIVKALEAEAVLLKCDTVFLLTTSAQTLFEKLGYTVIDRASVPAAIRATTQFAALCPASAAVMTKRLA
jgi:N-acetylglutamate synthase-like GNAT family acetyltransferase